MKKLILISLLCGLSLIGFSQEIINLDPAGTGSGGSATSGLSIGGGLAWYSNVNDADFSATPIDGGARVVVSGFAYTLDWKNVVIGLAKVQDSVTLIVESIPVSPVSFSGDTITFSGWTSTFTAGDEVVLWLGAPPRATDIAQNALDVIVKNAVYNKYTDIETVSFTNLDTDSSYAVFYMASYQFFNLHANISGGVTLTVYITNNSAADDEDETSDWVDYSSELLGGASIVDTEGMYFQDTERMPLKIMIKMVTSDATNAGDIFVRRHY